MAIRLTIVWTALGKVDFWWFSHSKVHGIKIWAPGNCVCDHCSIPGSCDRTCALPSRFLTSKVNGGDRDPDSLNDSEIPLTTAATRLTVMSEKGCKIWGDSLNTPLLSKGNYNPKGSPNSRTICKTERTTIWWGKKTQQSGSGFSGWNVHLWAEILWGVQ